MKHIRAKVLLLACMLMVAWSAAALANEATIPEKPGDQAAFPPEACTCDPPLLAFPPHQEGYIPWLWVPAVPPIARIPLLQVPAYPTPTEPPAECCLEVPAYPIPTATADVQLPVGQDPIADPDVQLPPDPAPVPAETDNADANCWGGTCSTAPAGQVRTRDDIQRLPGVVGTGITGSIVTGIGKDETQIMVDLSDDNPDTISKLPREVDGKRVLWKVTGPAVAASASAGGGTETAVQPAAQPVAQPAKTEVDVQEPPAATAGTGSGGGGGGSGGTQTHTSPAVASANGAGASAD